MKETTLQTLITARALLEQAERHCSLGDRYMATAGLIVLQDAVELVFLAALIEKGVDESRSVEKFTFDDMISALGQVGVKVPKSGTLKAMNKLRVAAKHYGQVMEPLTVQGHLNAAKVALDFVLNSVVGKPLCEVFLTELISNTPSRSHLEHAAACLERCEYLESLIATRKAFFLEFEKSYFVYQYRNAANNDSSSYGLRGFISGGWKAPYWTQNAKWIAEKVVTPFDYVQIDPETWRIDALEWGINTQTLNNIRRLTPEAIQFEQDGEWLLRYPASFVTNSANRQTAAACLDLTIEVIRRKRHHIRPAPMPSSNKPYATLPAFYIGQPLFERPELGSHVLRILEAGDKYVVHQILNGFHPVKWFYGVRCIDTNAESVWGYIERLEVSLDEDQPEVIIESGSGAYG